MSELISLQGYLLIHTRTAAGGPGRGWWAGNVPEAKLELTTDKEEKLESFSGGRGLYDTLNTKKAGRITGIFDEWKTDNLALGLYSTKLAVSSASVTGEELPADLVVGDLFTLKHPFASSLVITDSTGSPLTVSSSAYAKTGHASRSYEVKSTLASYVEPLEAAYTYAAYENLDVFNTEPQEVFVVFDGINTRTGQPVVYDLFRTKFDPFASTDLIHSGFGALNFGADILIDPLNLDGNGKGGYYRMRRKVMP